MFPALKRVGYQETSPPDNVYNCIAWANRKSDEWWSYKPGYKWPNANRSWLVESLVDVFVSLGFEKCVDATVEEGVDKVAIYARNGLWMHAARQLSTGQWTSKLGPDEDITHPTPESLCGPDYGDVFCVMRRPTL